MRLRKSVFLAIILTALVGAMGCGGGGGEVSTSDGGGSLPPPGGGGAPLPTITLTWVAPNEYTDNTPLNPLTDLDSFEIYVKESAPFTSSDTPLAYVSALDRATGRLNSSFNLGNLTPYLSKGVSYQVSLRAVAISGLKSAFSSPATFSF